MTQIDHQTAAVEAGMALKFGLVGLVGLAVDAAFLRLGMGLGLHAALARAVSLFFAMQVTFTINGVHVFHCLTRRKIIGQWAGYMAANGFGNLCNYWIFVSLISLHQLFFSNVYFALVVGSLSAYVINYAGTRLLVFGKGRVSTLRGLRQRAQAQVCGPSATTEGQAFSNLRPEARTTSPSS